MASERMTVARLAKGLETLSQRVEEGFAQVDARFAQVDARFAQTEATFHAELEQFAEKITHAFKINLERMEAKLDAALDDTREQKRRLDTFERTNAAEHQLMQAQIDDLDSRVPSRRGPRRRPS